MMQLALLVAWFELADTVGGRKFPWTGSEPILQAWVLFLVALRARPRAAVETLVIGAVPGLTFTFATGHGDRAPLAAAVLVIATVVGASLRGRQVARKRLTTLAPHGVDLVLDTAASGSLDDLVAIAGDPKRVATVADHAGGHRLGTHVAHAVNDSALLSAAAELGRQGRYTPRIEQVYPLERIADAHAHAERGRTRGKIVICI